MNPRLSVIIPTFNRAGFVRDCLVALKHSGIDDLEIIVIDDGGTDDTASVVGSIEPRAIYRRQQNQGPAAARNHGFRISKGRYVSFLDCDDEWLPESPAKALRLLETDPEIDLLFAEARMGNRQEGFVSWIETAGEVAFHELPSRQLEANLKLLDREPFFRRMVYRNAVFLGSCIMKREVFEKVGMFDEELCGAADWHLWLRMAAQLKFAFWSEPMAIYTKHLEGMSNDHDGMSREFCTTLKKLQHFEPLTPSQQQWVKERLRHHLFGFAYRAYDRGEFANARRRFADLIGTSGMQFKAVGYFLLCSLPFGMAGGLRRLKHLGSSKTAVPKETEAKSLAVRGVR